MLSSWGQCAEHMNNGRTLLRQDTMKGKYGCIEDFSCCLFREGWGKKTWKLLSDSTKLFYKYNDRGTFNCFLMLSSWAIITACTMYGPAGHSLISWTCCLLLLFVILHLSRDMIKPTKWVCSQRRLRSAWASAQSDQSLRDALYG